MRRFLGKPDEPIAQLFRDYLRYGGFPKSLEYDDPQSKARYIEGVVAQMIDKDIRARRKVRNRSTFERVMTYIINNYAAPTNLTGIAEYLRSTQKVPIKRETLAGYIELLENAVFTYLKSKDYRVSAGQIGRLEVDFIARRADEKYSYIQVSMTVADKTVEEREYRPFSRIRDNFPQYLLTLDPLPLERDGVTHRNIIDLMAQDEAL